jgi:hypothetical protein
MMSTDVNHGATLELLPIKPISFEAWAGLYRAALTKA